MRGEGKGKYQYYLEEASIGGHPIELDTILDGKKTRISMLRESGEMLMPLKLTSFN